MAGLLAAAAAAVECPLEKNSLEHHFEEDLEEVPLFEDSEKRTPEEAAKRAGRLDADHFRGLRDEMGAPETETQVLMMRAISLGHSIVTIAIFLNAVQMGAAIQFHGEPKVLWEVGEHVFTAIFSVEMMLKMYGWRCAYFYSTWNCLDCFVTCFSILSLWILAPLNLDLESLQSLRLLKLMRLIRLLRMNPEVKVLVESLLASVKSLGWILCLLFLISYIFAIICCQVVVPSLYIDDERFDPVYYFGDIPHAMLTLFNICILAEWGEIIRPISSKQPLVVIFIFLPYFASCTLGVLNLIIGVISEQTLANAQAVRDSEEHARLRAKMKAIIKMTDEIYAHDDDGNLSKEEFMGAAMGHPDFMDTLRQCNFPRGFEVKDLHTIFDDGAKGTISKDEFINGMFRLVFNDLGQHAATLLLGISQVKHELHDKMEEEMDKMYTMLQDRLPDMTPDKPNKGPDPPRQGPTALEQRDAKMSEPPLPEVVPERPSEPTKQDQSIPPSVAFEDDVVRMIAHMEERMGKFVANFEQKAAEAAQAVTTASARLETAAVPQAPPRPPPLKQVSPEILTREGSTQTQSSIVLATQTAAPTYLDPKADRQLVDILRGQDRILDKADVILATVKRSAKEIEGISREDSAVERMHKNLAQMNGRASKPR